MHLQNFSCLGFMSKISVFHVHFCKILFRGPKHLSWVTLCHAALKWCQKIVKKMRKCVFLFNGLELERFLEIRPPLIYHFRGGHNYHRYNLTKFWLRYFRLKTHTVEVIRKWTPCFPCFLLQILVKLVTQAWFWILLVMTIPKHPLHV